MTDKIPPPLIVDFTVTRQCNLRCKHCYADAGDSPDPKELNTEKAKQVIQEIARTGARSIVFAGGEPLLRHDIYELVSWARELGLSPLIGTNATLLGTENAGKLERAGVESIAISIDSSDPTYHDSFRGFVGGWERAVAGIHNAASAGLPFQIDPCLHRLNLAQHDAIIRKAKEWGAEAVEVFDYIPVGRARENPALALTAEERHALVREIIQHQLAEKKLSLRCIGIPQFWVEVKRTIPQEELARFEHSCCGAGWRYFSIFYDGTVYPCPMLQKSAGNILDRGGNIREGSLSQIWNKSKVFRVLRSRDKLEGKCGVCNYRWLCGGARCKVFARTGSLTKADKDCWLSEPEVREGRLIRENAGAEE